MGSTTTTLKGNKRRWNSAKDDALDALRELYCATIYDLARFVRHREPTLDDLRSTRALLQHIHEYDSHKTYWVRYPLNGGFIYGLSRYGAQTVNGRELIARDFEHERILTRFHIALKELCDKHGFQLEWSQKPLSHKFAIIPDAIATITAPNGRFVFAIEPERQTFTENHLKKAKKYHAIFGTAECKKQFGAEKIRVLFIQLTNKRRTTWLEKFAEEYPYRMFWFTTLNSLDSVAAKIFLTPKDWKIESYSLLDVLK
jgi:hypothetical protein